LGAIPVFPPATAVSCTWPPAFLRPEPDLPHNSRAKVVPWVDSRT